MFSSNILFSRTFLIISLMLLITSATAYINRDFETRTEYWITLILSFVALFAVMIFSDQFPVNLILVATFSGLMGWSMGPTITSIGRRVRKNNIGGEEKWNQVLSMTIFGTALGIFSTAGLIFFTDFDFYFLGKFLFIGLIVLIIIGILNMFLHFPLMRIFQSYFGVLIFIGYLLYDFSKLEKLAQNDTWSVAINLAVDIYLDIINLFLYLLQIFSDD